MELFDYLNRRRDLVNQHYQWLTSYRKKIESSPKIEDVFVLCDNLTNELMVLNNEVNYRLETAFKLQDEKINKLIIKIDEMHGSHADLEAIKEDQKSLQTFEIGLRTLRKLELSN